MTPTARTLKQLRKEGYVCQVVEKWNPYARIRQDLFGFIDIVAIKDQEILGVQATSASNLSARVHKALACPHLAAWLKANARFEVWGWSKKGPRGQAKHWQATRREFKLSDLEIEQESRPDYSVISRTQTSTHD
jgi:hypothetical protein